MRRLSRSCMRDPKAAVHRRRGGHQLYDEEELHGDDCARVTSAGYWMVEVRRMALPGGARKGHSTQK
ncbi:hypothetical protein GOP47_0030313, partial [Adiantum capillus-veneris]